MVTGIRGERVGTVGGRISARPLRFTAALLTAWLAGLSPAGAQTAPVTVEGTRGLYRVTATFATPQPAAIGHAVLTDYEQIPRFLPDVRSSRVLERRADRTVVEQEAIAKVLFFSKRVRLVLEVQDDGTRIAFKDASGESFVRYEGHWTLRDEARQALIAYQLTAQPRFDVPDFILQRLLRRDAERMIARLKAEIAARALRPDSLQSRR
jgi:ribosome-associated toxin RatA of RatAB toxin-antitoxin module